MMFLRNEIIWSFVLSFVTAQAIKAILNRDLRSSLKYGGMPSGHSAFIFGMTTSVGLTEGFGSSLFAVTLGFSLIIASDLVRLRSKISKDIAHTWAEVTAGGIVGIIVAVVVHIIGKVL
ncbi:MAG: divergent PAP2 family protein [Thermotogaceae bacterium]|nr:divergent PAP2 family protein [Thermotogaceae bacterium]